MPVETVISIKPSIICLYKFKPNISQPQQNTANFVQIFFNLLTGTALHCGTFLVQLTRMQAFKELYWRYSLFVLILGLGVTIFIELTPFWAGCWVP